MAGIRCVCGHGAGYHEAADGGDTITRPIPIRPPVGRCHSVSCDCARWKLAVTEPGVYEMSNDEYHADPVPGGSLSSTGARRLLPPGCPAQYRYDRPLTSRRSRRTCATSRPANTRGRDGR